MITFNNYLQEAFDKPVAYKGGGKSLSFFNFEVGDISYDLETVKRIEGETEYYDVSLSIGHSPRDYKATGYSTQGDYGASHALKVYATVADIFEKHFKGKSVEFFGFDAGQKKLYPILLKYFQKRKKFEMESSLDNKYLRFKVL